MFESIYRLAEKTGSHEKSGQPRATRATEVNKPQNSDVIGPLGLVAHSPEKGQPKGNSGQPLKPAEPLHSLEVVAQVAQDAQENEQEQLNHEIAIVRWLNTHPPQGLDPDHCAQCRRPLGRIGEDAIPVLSGVGGHHVWLHHGCHSGWMAKRTLEAKVALAELGLSSRGKSK